MQPLAFSKELLPVGTRLQEKGCSLQEQPKAISEYLLERMVAGGATRLCIVISPGKSDILEYYGASYQDVPIVYVVQPSPAGLCDALFRATPLVGKEEEEVMIGLPDTLWYPRDGFALLPTGTLCFLLFPVAHPEFFDAVVLDVHGSVIRIDVKKPEPASSLIWGAVRMPSAVYKALHHLWQTPARGDEYLGTLINAWLDAGGAAKGVAVGQHYVDTGTPHGYREALRLLDTRTESADPWP